MSDTPVTIPALQQMKRDGKKSVGLERITKGCGTHRR